MGVESVLVVKAAVRKQDFISVKAHRYGSTIPLANAEAGTIGFSNKKDRVGIVFVAKMERATIAFIVFDRPIKLGDQVTSHLTLGQGSFHRWGDIFVWDDLQIEPGIESLSWGYTEAPELFAEGEEIFLAAAGPRDSWGMAESLSINLSTAEADTQSRSSELWRWARWVATVPRADGLGRQTVFKSPVESAQP